MPLIQVINVKLRHVIMYLLRFREANRLSLIPLQVPAEVQLVALDALQRLFADLMTPLRQQLLIRLSIIGSG